MVSQWEDWELDTPAANANNDSPNPPSASPAWGQAPCLWIAACTTAYTGIVTDAPSGYTNLTTTTSTTPMIATTAELKAEAATEDPGAFTCDTSAQWYAYTVAVRGPDTSGWGAVAI